VRVRKVIVQVEEERYQDGWRERKIAKEEKYTVHFKFDNSCLSYTLFQPKKLDEKNVVIYIYCAH
jgi:hypothetical protein